MTVEYGRLDNLPLAMRERKQWLLWRSETYEGDKKPRKIPYYLSGGKRTGVQGDDADRGRLATFEHAVERLLADDRYTGLGFAFLPGDGLIGIDIDNAINPDTGEMRPELTDIIGRCASYTERSPSGRGVHIIVSGQTETFKDNRVGVEVFCSRQFFTCSGDRWEGTPADVQPISQEALDHLRHLVRGAKAQATAQSAAAIDPTPKLRKPRVAAAPVDDFKRINALAMAFLDTWVPLAFPSAKRLASGVWRVSSKALGRNLQEDLSLHRDGIKDFGDEVGLSPIDVVVKFTGRTPVDALKWLAATLGMPLEPAKKPRSAQHGDGVADRQNNSPERPASLEIALIRGGRGGGIVDCRENVFQILNLHPDLTGLVAFNQFSHRAIKTRRPPWRSDAGDWTDQDDLQLGFWITTHLGITVKATRTITDGVAMAAYNNSFHPVLQYLDALPAWDGIERLPYWLSKCAGAAETDYTRLVGPWFIMNLVRRVRHPGCQADYMVVLEGQQGKRKSTLLRTLVGNDDWFADTPMKIGDKDALLSLAGKWLYEFGELDSFGKAEATTVKQYLTSRIDRVREPFARRHEDRPRSCCFAGTTNQGEYIKDSTGGRRFWPVSCDDEIDLARMAEWRDQLFAEAEHRLRSDDADVRRCWPTRLEEEKYLEPEQEARQIGDPWYDRIAWWVDNGRIPQGETSTAASMRDSFTSAELLNWALGVPFDRIDGGRQMTTRVGIIMHKLNWKKQRHSTGARIWRFVRPKTSAGGPATDSGSPDEGIVDVF